MENIKEKFENWFTEQHNKWFVKNFNGSCFALMKYNDNVRLKYEKIADNRRYIINSTIDSENKIKPVSNKFAKEMFDKLKAGEKDYVIDSLVNLFNSK